MIGWIVGHWWFTYPPALFPSPKAGIRESSSPLITGCFPLETVPNLQCSQKSPQYKHRGFLQRTRYFSPLHHYRAISAPGHKKHQSKCNQDALTALSTEEITGVCGALGQNTYVFLCHSIVGMNSVTPDVQKQNSSENGAWFLPRMEYSLMA